MSDRGLQRHSSWLERDLKVPRAALIARHLRVLCLTILSHAGSVVHLRYTPPTSNHTAAQTPLVSLELSGMGSILGPRSPFSPGWFVPFSIPTSEMPESEATCIVPTLAFNFEDRERFTRQIRSVRHSRYMSHRPRLGVVLRRVAPKSRRTGASPGALPLV